MFFFRAIQSQLNLYQRNFLLDMNNVQCTWRGINSNGSTFFMWYFHNPHSFFCISEATFVSKPHLHDQRWYCPRAHTSVMFPFWFVVFPLLNANIGESLVLEASSCINSRCSFSYQSSVGLKLRFRCWKRKSDELSCGINTRTYKISHYYFTF